MIRQEWTQPVLSGSGFVHLDATYWGHNWGVMLAVDSASGFPLYMSLIKHETIADYRAAVNSIEERGYVIRGIIIDGMPSLFKEFCSYNVQMCHFHMMQIARRYLTKKPKLIAARELKFLLYGLTSYREDELDASTTIGRRDGRRPLIGGRMAKTVGPSLRTKDFGLSSIAYISTCHTCSPSSMKDVMTCPTQTTKSKEYSPI